VRHRAYQEHHEQAGKQLGQTAFACLHLFKQMFRVQATRYELCTFLGHSPQQPFPAFVDKRHIIQVDDASLTVLSAVTLFPARSQFANPPPDQPALQNPSLFRLRLGDSDFQHAVPLLPVKCIRLRPDNGSAAGKGVSYCGRSDLC
jgi:hypothetical protein